MNRKKEVPFRQMRGKGLDALFGDVDLPNSGTVRIDLIQLPAQQPRRYFDADKLAQLVESVKAHGIIEPLLVRPLGGDRYELVAGERRYRAAQAVGLTEVPIAVRNLTSSEALQLALIENLQREDLNPIEETEGILQLLAFRLNCPIADVSSLLYRMNNVVVGNTKKTNHNVMISSDSELVKTCFLELGKMSWESFTRNRLPLLKLPPDILTCLQQGKLEYTKAKAIAQVKDEIKRSALLKQVIEQDLSLKEIRDRIATLQAEVIEAVEQDLEPSLKSRFTSTYERVKKSKVWQNPKKQKKLEKLLLQLEKLCDDQTDV